MIERQSCRRRNRGCTCEIKVIKVSIEAHANPLCCRGAKMKKHYWEPALRSLNSDIQFFVSSKIKRNRNWPARPAWR
jgi:hypothetical protein